MEDTRYIEFIVDEARNRGYFIPVEKLKSFITANMGKVMYHSYYLYDHEVITHMEKYNTLKGFSGPRYPYKIILDIDSEEDLLKGARAALEIHEYLVDYHEIAENNIQFWFSGGKGFHIHLPNLFGFKGGKALPNTVKATLKQTFSRWEEFVDLMPVSNTGIIRCPWSGHRSGMMKVPLEYDHLQAIAQEVLQPQHFADDEHYEDQFTAITEPMDEDDNGKLSSLLIFQDASQNHHQLNDMDKPNSVVTCMQKLLLRGPIKGRRHKDSLRLVSNWRRQGIPATFSAMMLIEWLGVNPDSSEAEEFRKIVRDVYQQQYAYSCKDEVMSEYCDSQCIFFKNKDYILEVSDNDSMMNDYKNYLKTISSNGIDIKQAFGFNGEYKILPGEVAVITGDTGMGKSAFIQNLMEKASQKTLYLNMEMHEALLYRRFLQIQYQMSKQEVNYQMEQGTDFSEALSWLHILSTSPDVSDLDRLISQKDYKYVVVDTSDGVQAKEAGNNEYRKLGMIINTLREIAQARNISIILIHHIKKMGEYRNRITLDDLSGNRANVTKMDHVFVLEGKDDKRWLRSLKTRDGEKATIPFVVDFNTFTFKKQNNYDPRNFSTSGIQLGQS